MALQETYAVDFAAWANGVLSVTVGIVDRRPGHGADPPVSPDGRLRRLVAAGRADLAAIAGDRWRPQADDLAERMFDRIVAIAPRLAAPEGAAAALDEALADLGAGLDLLRLRAERARLAPSARRAADLVSAKLGAALRRARRRRSSGASIARSAGSLRESPGDGALDAALALDGIGRMARRRAADNRRRAHDGEVDICGVFFPGFLIAIGRRPRCDRARPPRARRRGAYRLIWRAPLFDFALAVIVLGGITAAQGGWPWRDPRRWPDRDHRGGGAARRLQRLARLGLLHGEPLDSRRPRARRRRRGGDRRLGPVSEVAVRDNQRVRKGQLLFRIDGERAALALRQAEATLAERKATPRSGRTGGAAISGLLGSAAVSQQKQEQAQTSYEEADAAYRQALADRDLAELNLARTDVVAPVNGVVANVSLRPGDYVSAGQGLLALINSASLRVEGYFEETKLARIHVGDPVVVHLMGEGRELSGASKASRRESPTASVPTRAALSPTSIPRSTGCASRNAFRARRARSGAARNPSRGRAHRDGDGPSSSDRPTTDR